MPLRNDVERIPRRDRAADASSPALPCARRLSHHANTPAGATLPFLHQTPPQSRRTSPSLAQSARPAMKIFCICMVKNESDIIAQTLKDAASWANSIFVYDNGSTDDTWEKVLTLSKSDVTVVPYKSDPKPFSNSMRCEPFTTFRHQAEEGDWWCILDSDEIYAENPRYFLKNIPFFYQIVWAISIQYKLTDEDLRIFEEDPARYGDEVPVAEKIRYYRTDWSEARFFRYNQKLVWPKDRAFPLAGAVYPERILMKHYKHRSPTQLRQRLDVRKGVGEFRHENSDAEWQNYIMRATEMDYDHHNGQYNVRNELLPKLPLTSRLPPRLVNLLRGWKR